MQCEEIRSCLLTIARNSTQAHCCHLIYKADMLIRYQFDAILSADNSHLAFNYV